MRKVIKGLLIIVGGLVVLVIIIGLASGGAKQSDGRKSSAALGAARRKHDTTSTTAVKAAATTSLATTTTTPATTTTTQPKIVPLLHQTGSGIASLPAFTVSSNATGWGLAWSYDCSGSFGGNGNFIVDIVRPGGGYTSDPGVNELGTSGHAIEYYYDHGLFQLQINSECNWSVTVAEQN